MGWFLGSQNLQDIVYGICISFHRRSQEGLPFLFIIFHIDLRVYYSGLNAWGKVRTYALNVKKSICMYSFWTPCWRFKVMIALFQWCMLARMNFFILGTFIVFPSWISVSWLICFPSYLCLTFFVPNCNGIMNFYTSPLVQKLLDGIHLAILKTFGYSCDLTLIWILRMSLL